MPSPSVSVVIPSRGGAARLPTLIASLAQQTTVDWEAIVVLDGDIDGSAGVVAAASHDLPVHLVTFASNRGRAAALNAGFDAARGEVIVRCDDDLVPASDYLRRHYEAHARDVVGVVGLYRNVYPDTAYTRVYGRDWDARFREQAYASDPGSAWRYWAGNVSVGRDTWTRVGEYDESFRAYGYEDVDWGYRLATLGVPIVLDAALETEHRIAATTCASRAQRAYYAGAARAHFEAKHAIGIDHPRSSTPWNRSVDTLARPLTEGRAERIGTILDAGVDLLPGRVAQKAVALLVEASAVAGNRAGRTSGRI